MSIHMCVARHLLIKRHLTWQEPKFHEIHCQHLHNVQILSVGKQIYVFLLGFWIIFFLFRVQFMDKNIFFFLFFILSSIFFYNWWEIYKWKDFVWLKSSITTDIKIMGIFTITILILKFYGIKQFFPTETVYFCIPYRNLSSLTKLRFYYCG